MFQNLSLLKQDVGFIRENVENITKQSSRREISAAQKHLVWVNIFIIQNESNQKKCLKRKTFRSGTTNLKAKSKEVIL
jgi:hypothetical protein